jgi:hypothetical protein
MSSTPPTPATLRTTEPEPEPVRTPDDSSGPYIECGFCHCKVTKKGHVYEISQDARDFRDHKEDFLKQRKALEDQIADLQKTISAKDAEISALKGSGAAGKKKSTFI